MILIPEQVHILREKIYSLEEQLRDYKEYLKTCDKSFLEPGGVHFEDSTLEVQNKNKLEEHIEAYKQILKEAEFLSKVDDSRVGYGTTVVIKYDEEEETEKYTIAENSTGLSSTGFNSTGSYLSSDSKLTKAIMGLKEGDKFSYKVSVKGKKDSLVITGKILEIIKQKDKNINFIISRGKSQRFSKKSMLLIKSLKEQGNDEELERMMEITYSQYELLKEEQEKLLNIISKYRKYNSKIMLGSIITLKNEKNKISQYQIVDKDDIDLSREIDINSAAYSNLITKTKGDKIDTRTSYYANGKKRYKYYCGTIVGIDNSFVPKEESLFSSINEVYGKLRYVNEYLAKSKIVTPKEDGKIGIGSKVSIITFENGEVQNRRVEIINQAVSTELSTDYIEAYSPFGQAILNADENNHFFYYYGNARLGDGIIYDVNNNIYERKAPDPLTYQKKRRG